MLDAIACPSCGATFDVIWGVPFVGHYEGEDVPGLIEIAANARADNVYASRADVQRIDELLEGYHDAPDRAQFLAQCNDEFAHAPWFANRYTEYSAFRSLSTTVELAGRDVLDVGAGTGYDALRLARAGAHVTAFEYNPVLVRRGRAVVPEARWIGGFAHALPFDAQSFDVVCCNAALHHMRDVPSAMHEMLRVLRPGGCLLTIGDPFRADSSSEETEFEVFDNHPDVLLGVNESIPRFEALVSTLRQNRHRLDVRFLTSSLSGLRESWHGRLRRALGRSTSCEWSFAETDRLSAASGTISIKAYVRGPLDLRPLRERETLLRAGEYAGVLDDYEAALTMLVGRLPSTYMDRPFPGSEQTKFELLNGWQKPRRGTEGRSAYKRARWFLTRPASCTQLRFLARTAAKARRETPLEVRVGTVAVTRVSLTDAWNEVAVSLSGVDDGARFVCELRVLPDGEELEFDDYRFVVKGRSFVRAGRRPSG